MKKHRICIIGLAFILGACASRNTPPAEFVPVARSSIVPFNNEDDEGPRLEIRLNLSEATDSKAGIDELVRQLLYKGQSAEDYGNAIIEEYTSLYDEQRTQWTPDEEDRLDSFNWYYDEDIVSSFVSVKKFLPGYKTLLTLTKTTDTYTGGAHGNSVITSFVIDMAAIKRLTLDDLFGNREELRRLLEAELHRQYRLPEEAPLSQAGFFEDTLELPENFLITQNAPDNIPGATGQDPHISFLWNTYEIAPYVMGPVRVDLPLREMSGLLRR
jgi:hypothetical protein